MKEIACVWYTPRICTCINELTLRVTYCVLVGSSPDNVWRQSSRCHCVGWRRNFVACHLTAQTIYGSLGIKQVTRCWRFSFKSSPQHVENNIINTKLDSYDLFLVVVCSLRHDFSRVPSSTLPSLTIVFNSSPQRVKNNVISWKLYSYDLFFVVVRNCTA